MDMADSTGDADAALHHPEREDSRRVSLAESGLEMGECVIHKIGYEPQPARRGNVPDGSCDLDLGLFIAEDGSQPEWLTVFLEEYPRPGAAVGFTATKMRGSWAPWEQKPETGNTLGSWI